MFRGNQRTRVDEKGRLKVPSEFKRLCDELYGPQFFITSLDGEHAEIFPMQEWEKIEAQVATMSGPAKKRFLFVANSFGQVVEMDAQGRLLLPQALREKTMLTGDAAVLGMQTHLTVVNEEKLNKSLDAEPLTDDDLAVLAIPGL
jgi:MraZ protein